MIITATDVGQQLHKLLFIFIKTVSVKKRAMEKPKEVLLPRGKSHQNRKGNWSARSESFLHGEQQHSFYEGVEGLGLFWLKTWLVFSKMFNSYVVQ